MHHTRNETELSHIFFSRNHDTSKANGGRCILLESHFCPNPNISARRIFIKSSGEIIIVRERVLRARRKCKHFVVIRIIYAQPGMSSATPEEGSSGRGKVRQQHHHQSCRNTKLFKYIKLPVIFPNAVAPGAGP